MCALDCAHALPICSLIVPAESDPCLYLQPHASNPLPPRWMARSSLDMGFIRHFPLSPVSPAFRRPPVPAAHRSAATARGSRSSLDMGSIRYFSLSPASPALCPPPSPAAHRPAAAAHDPRSPLDMGSIRYFSLPPPRPAPGRRIFAQG
jgi:hypothetical protein